MQVIAIIPERELHTRRVVDHTLGGSSIMYTSSDIKAALRDAGLFVYRTLDDAVVIAERVRDNLILDSGARIAFEPLAVVFVVRAQASSSPGVDDGALFERARAIGPLAAERGFRERSAEVVPILDPNDPAKAIDRSFEVAFERAVSDLDEAIEVLRWVLMQPRSV